MRELLPGRGDGRPSGSNPMSPSDLPSPHPSNAPVRGSHWVRWLLFAQRNGEWPTEPRNRPLDPSVQSVQTRLMAYSPATHSPRCAREVPLQRRAQSLLYVFPSHPQTGSKTVMQSQMHVDGTRVQTPNRSGKPQVLGANWQNSPGGQGIPEKPPHEAPSRKQSPEQRSPSTLLPSSHSSPESTTKSPQNGSGQLHTSLHTMSTQIPSSGLHPPRQNPCGGSQSSPASTV